MLKGRGRDPRDPRAPPPSAAHFMLRAGAPRPPAQAQRPLPKPEPDYEVVEFPSEQYVNAKLQPPPPPPPRPPTGHPAQAGASCGLCGGGGARVRCAECGRRALCASCDDMYHRHPKRRDHQRQALTPSQLAVDERPPLPPKATPPVPPPRRHKISASPKPMGTMPIQDQRRATLSHAAAVGLGPSIRTSPVPPMMPTMQHPVHMHSKMATGSHLGSMPYLPTAVPHPGVLPPHVQPNANTLGHLNAGWNRPRGSHGSLQGFNMQQHMMANPETWENSDMVNPGMQSWSRPLRRGASVLELGGGINLGGSECGGCANAWRYGSCAALDQPWAPGWPAAPAPCCAPHAHHHAHHHAPQTPQPYRRADSRAVSRAASRTGSRAASPALSMRSRTSRRTKHRTPSPPALPSSDADSESESETDTRNRGHMTGKIDRVVNRRVESRPESRSDVRPSSRCGDASRPERAGSEAELGPPPAAPAAPWHCEHCTFLNEAGVRVCAVCCRTPTAVPTPATLPTQMERLSIARSPSPARNIQRFSEEKIEKPKKERVSTGCGPSPPKEEKRTMPSRTIQRLETPTREQNGTERVQTPSIRHDMAIGPSPPRESPASKIVDNHLDVPHRVAKQEPIVESPARHSVSVGPSPPRENSTRPVEKSPNFQKKSAGTSPPPGRTGEGSTSVSSRTKVSSGTSPPPQSISTQTYEDPSTWERPASAPRSRDRRRFRDDARRERSRSRHSLSSDTKESDRSVRTTGAWEWRSRDASPPPPRRRASHLDLRRLRRRDSLYGSEATSPERWSGGGRAASMEALAGGAREAERGLELARLLADAERLGYNAAEVQAALTQSPGAPLAWLQARWAGLAGAVRGAAQRLARRPPTEREARAALARHRGAVWPAVTDCVDAIRRQGAEPAALRGRVWGSPAGADDDAAPCTRGEDSSDEYARGPYPDEEWYASDEPDRWSPAPRAPGTATVTVADAAADNVARKLRDLLLQAGIPALNENLLLKSLLTQGAPPNSSHLPEPMNEPAVDFIQSENDFIDAYNALTRASPLPVTKGFNDREQIVNGEKVPNGHFIETDVEPQKITPVIKINPSEAKNLDQNHNLINNIWNENLTSDPPIVIPNKESSTVENVITVNKTNKVEEHENTIRQPVDLLPQRVQKDIVLTLNTSKEQTGEKSNNLNEIVDSTQKLIQQMKDEINSDINSIDGRQSDSSHSDHDSSSHDEHESSYSETEGGSDHSSITSEESKDFSEQYSEHEGVESLEHRDVNRTSSEDNEQFEEALDHIENQTEDVKNINIDILNSIAHSLQQELTISVEKEIVETESEAEDSSDNLFVAVNSFEEIYEELNTPVKPIRIIPQKIIVKPPIEPKVMLPKYTATEMSFKSVTPTQLIITDNRQQLHRADLDAVEVGSASEKENSPEPLEVQELATTVISNQERQTPETNTEAEGNTAEVITNEPNAAEANTIEANAAAANTTEANAAEANAVEINAAETNTTEVIAAVINTAKSKIAKVNTATTNTDEIHAAHTNTAEAETELNRVNDNDITNIASHVNTPASHIAIEPDNTTNNNNSRTNNNQELQIKNGDIKRDTNITKSSASVKSNIPKPVRSPPKSKVEKAPKLIVSKVPVRKTSTKAYPAPAPPKSHFGNVQSGLVKQLQNKIFNNPVKIVTTEKESKQNAAIKDEPQPSTSQIAAATVTINKRASPQKTVSKNNYFRETCRTEDEWTDSDSDDQSQVLRTTEQKEHTPVEYSPPPPVTLRRVSGNIIDLATIQLPEGSPERQARMLLAGGATETWEQAQLAVQLVARGAAPAAALLAALECRDLDAALAYLHQECELCASRLPEHEMVSMLRCTHRCCRECARLYFNVQITERSIADCVCPFCKLPELEILPEDAWLEYFAHLDILLKTLLETDVHELFQRKLRDRTLARDPNFKWCMECSSGFFVHPKQKRLRCPECRSVTCASCRKPWTSNHEGVTCEQYAAWLDDNDPERSVAAVQQHLRENGLECPRCHFKYSLSRGGCMHFTCTQCKYEFCYGCGKPFTMGARCGLSDYCAKLGLHAHHPRNCLFYLRDKEPHELQTLLQMNNVQYETAAGEGATGRCPVQLQRETPTGLVDGICGHEAPPNYAGLCKNHYVEYLTRVVRGARVEPLPLLSVEDLETLVRRAALRPPPRPYGSLDGVYRRALSEIVREKIPLD